MRAIATGSTSNLSHKRNSPRRDPIYLRAWPMAKQMLYRAGVTERDIADEASVPLATVSRALSLKHSGKTGHAAVLAVRRACETLLPELTAEHWEEYDHAQ